MKRIKYYLFCLLTILVSSECMSQKYWIESLSFEGIRLNGHAIHPSADTLFCSLNDTLQLRDGSDCIVGSDRGFPWLGHCCAKNVDGIITVKDAFRRKKAHIKKYHHEEDASPIIISGIYKGGIDVNEFYWYLSGRPQIEGVNKFAAKAGIFENDTKISIRISEDSLLIKNNSSRIVYAVAYVVEGASSIKRMQLIKVPWGGKEGLVGFVKKDYRQTFYVFYSQDYDKKWDCLKITEPIKCYKEVFMPSIK